MAVSVLIDEDYDNDDDGGDDGGGGNREENGALGGGRGRGVLSVSAKLADTETQPDGVTVSS